jgi:hypothetical protein
VRRERLVVSGADGGGVMGMGEEVCGEQEVRLGVGLFVQGWWARRSGLLTARTSRQ